MCLVLCKSVTLASVTSVGLKKSQCLKRTLFAPVVVAMLRFLQTVGTESSGHLIKTPT